METNKMFDKLFQPLCLIGIFALIVGFAISGFVADIRYLAIGMILFSIMYLGNFAFWLAVMVKKEKKSVDKILPIVNFVTLSFLAIGVFLYGVALFLWHYDNSQLLDLLNNITRKIIIR